MNVELAEKVYWVGYVDWDIRDFHGYWTERGSTYNSYLILDEKIALVDTVKAPFAEHLLGSISPLLDGRKPDYIICNHAEPDHSGSLPKVLQAYPQAELVCDSKCQGMLAHYYDTSGWNFKIVAEGDVLSLGKRQIKFIETPMVHWPESMFTFLEPDGILFSMDAFGQHLASEGRFDDEVDPVIALDEAKIYFANIVMLYGKPIAKVLGKAGDLGIKLIAPSHGVMWRSHIDKIVSAYADWVLCKATDKVLVVYDTMWGSTDMMAQAIADGVREGGAKAKVIRIRESHITEVATEALDAAVLAFGSPTLNMTLMPQMAAALTYLKGLRPVGKAGQAFGSYGWGKGGPEEVHKYLHEGIKCEILGDPIRSQFVPDAGKLDECRAAGRAMAAKALEMARA